MESVIANPIESYEDMEHNLTVAIGSLDSRTLVVVYEGLDEDVMVITVYHTRKIEKVVSSKIGRGAWRKIS